MASTLELEEADVLKAVHLYTEALMLLDQYDHQSLHKPEGNKPIYRMTYEECRSMVDAMKIHFVLMFLALKKKKKKLKGYYGQSDNEFTNNIMRM